MEFATGTVVSCTSSLRDLPALTGQRVHFHGAVHALRPMGGVSFLTLRTRRGLLQCVCPAGMDLPCEESAV